jgi:hypothetical protein
MKTSSFLRHIISGYFVLSVFSANVITAATGSDLIVSSAGDGFTLSVAGKSAPLFVSDKDYPGVIRAAKDLQSDIGKVTGAVPQLFTEKVPKSKHLVIAGTLGKSPVIDKLVGKGLIRVDQIAGKWECFQIQVVQKPLPGVKEALVVVGSDKRGTIYGLYEISSGIGVSPWYWWADVPVEHRDALYVSVNGAFKLGPPSVKYRGIFLNDEYPNLTRWVSAKFGTAKVSENPPVPEGIANYGREFYTKLFELILRLRGNYLWPAMWNNAFNEDDPENPRLADEYGVVMGNSHQEPMLRAQKEWDRRYQSTLGSWNYAMNPEVLQNFWREGIRRNKDYESIITIGLRGANDTEMAPGGPEANMAMLEDIVDVQRKILSEEINPDVTKIPQLWCLYKEVQEYYKAGMRVPDDVTLLWAEDNWGNIRRVPSAEERKRSGGAGIYYHFDYHGGPRSYQWANTSPLPRIWDQMTFARQYGADRVWIVNVGHFKAYSLPIHYFMDLAWFGDSLTHDNIREYTRAWTVQQFGTDYADETADILTQYTRFNGRRKPELLSPATYSLVDYNEAEKVVFDYNKIAKQAEDIYAKLPAEKRDAYYQLVLFPAKTGTIVNELYLAAGRNLLHASQKRASTNDWATITETLFNADTALMGYFNNTFASGKWHHFMDQPHLGYISWRDPPVNSLQHISLKKITVPDIPEMGITMEGSLAVWPDNPDEASLPEFDVFNRQSRYIEVFNKGGAYFEFTITSESPWIKVSNARGVVEKDMRIWVGIDWEKAPEGKSQGIFTVSGLGRKVDVSVNAFKPVEITPASLQGFVESNGYVSIEAGHYSKNTEKGENRWIEIEDFGPSLSGMRATTATDAPALTPGKDAPCLEYQMYLFSNGQVEVNPIVAPTLNFLPGRAVRYGVSFDNEDPQIITLVPENFDARNGNRDWESAVSDNFRIGKSLHQILNPGYHVLKIWMVDPGVVIQKIVVNTGGVKPSYLGPPESYYVPLKN